VPPYRFAAPPPVAGRTPTSARASSGGQALDGTRLRFGSFAKPGLAESDLCRGYFPGTASDDLAGPAVMATIGKDGAVSGV
jgi:hypothetical protein